MIHNCNWIHYGKWKVVENRIVNTVWLPHLNKLNADTWKYKVNKLITHSIYGLCITQIIIFDA